MPKKTGKRNKLL